VNKASSKGSIGALSARKDFREVYARGRRTRRDGVTVIGAPSTAGGGESRVGFVVPRSVGTAVVRNRIRRRLRAVFAQVAPVAGFDVVVRGEAQVAEIEFQQLVGEVRRALVGAGIECAG
jgi:ribonuclease P protein component